MKYRVLNEISFIQDDPRPYTAIIHDQSIVIGWAGYDKKTKFLPPEQFLVHSIRRDIIASLKRGPLVGQGPDGKFLVIIRESGGEFVLEEVVVTLQHRRSTDLRELRSGTEKVFENHMPRSGKVTQDGRQSGDRSVSTSIRTANGSPAAATATIIRQRSKVRSRQNNGKTQSP